MAGRDEISSTEKLLDLIREDNDKVHEPATLSPDPSPVPGGEIPPPLRAEEETRPETNSAPFFSNVIPMRKKATVGVDIGYHELKMSMVNQVSERKYELLDVATVPFPEGTSQNSPAFPAFLKKALTDFCSSNRQAVIWAAISAARVETRNLKIPKVSKKQIDNAVYWTLKKDFPFDENEMIFDFDVLGDIIEDGVNKIEVMAYVAPKQETVHLKNLFVKIGFPLTGVTIVPFGIQNLLRTNIIDARDQLVCSLFIGRDWSRIVIYSRGNMVLSRGIKAGIRSMIEAVAQEIGNRPVDTVENTIDPSESSIFGLNEETYIFDIEQARQIFFDHISSASTLNDGRTGQVFKGHDVFAMILPAVERLVKQVERTLEHYYLHFGNERMGRIFISGQLSAYSNLIAYMREQLDIRIDTLDPFSARLNYLGIAALPTEPSAKEAYAPAIGLALANNMLTPNFIFTYKDKMAVDRGKRINRIIAAGVIFFMALCSGIYIWGNSFLKEKNRQLALLQQEVENFKPLVSKNLIISLASKTKNKRKSLKKMGERYKGVAVINEIAGITPSEIKLLSITADFGDVSSPDGLERRQTLVLEGIISGDRLTFESTLAGYIVKIGSSPLFSKPSVENKSFKFIGNREVLQFRAMLDLV